MIRKKNTPIDQDYFDARLLFLTIDDFVVNRERIKAAVGELGIDEIYYYRLYVYSRPFIADMWKDYIWDFLMGDMNDLDFVTSYTTHKKRPVL